MTVHAPTPRPPRVTRTRLALAAATGLALVVAAGIGLYPVVVGSPESVVRSVVVTFAGALDREDHPALLDVLCAQEAAAVVEDDDYDPAAGSVAPSGLGEPVVTDVRIDDEGRTATALAALPGRSPVTIHLLREGGRWTVCHP